MRTAILIAALLSGAASAGQYDATLAEMCEKIANNPAATQAALVAAQRYCEGIAPTDTVGRISGRLAERDEAFTASLAPAATKPAPEPAPTAPQITRGQQIAKAKSAAQSEITACEHRIEMARAAIAREKQVADVSGYEDARKLHWLGQEIVACREIQNHARRRLAALKTNPDAILEAAKPKPVLSTGGRVRPE